MALARKNLLFISLLGTILLILSPFSNAQKRYQEEEEEELGDPTLTMNRAGKRGDDQMQLEDDDKPRAVKSKSVPLLDTFRGTKKPVVGDGVWKERGQALLWYDAEDQLISVEVTNNEA